MCGASAAAVPPFLMPRVLRRLARRLPGLALACSRLSTSRRRRPSRHACRRHRQLLLAHATPLPALRHAQQWHHDLCYSLKHFFPRHFSFPTTAPHRTSAAPSGRRRQPPTPLPIPNPALLEHRRDFLQLIDQSNFTFLHPSIIPRSASDLKLRHPLSLAVDPTLQSPSTPTKSTNSTTSSRRSFLATPSPPSDTPATRTPCRHRRR
jgi:hypothetical protein